MARIAEKGFYGIKIADGQQTQGDRRPPMAQLAVGNFYAAEALFGNPGH